MMSRILLYGQHIATVLQEQGTFASDERICRCEWIFDADHLSYEQERGVQEFHAVPGAVLLDVRTAEEYGQGHIEGFRNIPVDELRERLDQLEPGKPVYVICQSGLRSYIACRILAGYGFDCYNFSGGFRFYDAVTHDRCLVEHAADCGMDR